MKWKMGFSIIPTQILMDERLSRSCLDRVLGFNSAYISRKEILFSLNSNDSEGSPLIPPNVIKQSRNLSNMDTLRSKDPAGGVSKYYLKVLV